MSGTANRTAPMPIEGTKSNARHVAPPVAGHDLTESATFGRWLRMPSWQFQVILPNQVLFWVVIVVGLVGSSDPQLNFATAITWYVWFCLLFALIITTGRGWCAVCPFGGLAEWLQRRRLWGPAGGRRPLGLGLPFPHRLSQYGYLIPVATFALLTWIEEFFGIAGPGDPPLTSAMVVGIIVVAVISFLVFERRTFCRYLCPLSSVIGVLGMQAPLAGFRARDRRTCLTCRSRECLRGGPRTQPCAWFNWPGSAESNLNCGLCGECLRACPVGNVGLRTTRPLAGVIHAGRRRADVAWAVAGLAGIVIYQQVNATRVGVAVDDALNAWTHLPHYPNPIAYLVAIGLVMGLAALPAALTARRLLRPGAGAPAGSGTGTEAFVYRSSQFRVLFLPLMYAAIPLVGADYLARQLPKFLDHAAAVIPAATRLLGWNLTTGSTSSGLTHAALATPAVVVLVQVLVIGAGTLASVYVAHRIAGAELAEVVRRPRLVSIGMVALLATAGAVLGWLYVVLQAAE